MLVFGDEIIFFGYEMTIFKGFDNLITRLIL